MNSLKVSVTLRYVYILISDESTQKRTIILTFAHFHTFPDAVVHQCSDLRPRRTVRCAISAPSPSLAFRDFCQRAHSEPWKLWKSFRRRILLVWRSQMPEQTSAAMRFPLCRVGSSMHSCSRSSTAVLPKIAAPCSDVCVCVERSGLKVKHRLALVCVTISLEQFVLGLPFYFYSLTRLPMYFAETNGHSLNSAHLGRSSAKQFRAQADATCCPGDRTVPNGSTGTCRSCHKVAANRPILSLSANCSND